MQYKGKQYSIPANGFASIPEEVAGYWQSQIHNFLLVTEDKVEAPAVEAVAAPVEKEKTAVKAKK